MRAFELKQGSIFGKIDFVLLIVNGPRDNVVPSGQVSPYALIR
jgi:hypothetical protein